MADNYSINVLQECIALQLKKSNDYQNPNSTIKQADYYPNGCSTIFDIMHAKMLRIKSVMEAMQNDPSYIQNFESLEDSAKDLINYASFFCSYLNHEIDGQRSTHDFLNRPIKTNQANNTITITSARPVDTSLYSTMQGDQFGSREKYY